MTCHNRFSATILVIAAFCCIGKAADLHGIVTDSAGVPISGAAVSLETGTQKTTTASDGTFTIAPPVSVLTPSIPGYSHLSRGESLILDISGPAEAVISIFTLQGRRLSEVAKTVQPGRQTLRVQPPTPGMYVYKVTNDKGTIIEPAQVRHLNKTLSAAAGQSDVLRVEKPEFITFRRAVTVNDTSLLSIKLVPCADSVTDFDGNVYQAVKIGNQIWTVENLRSTKYRNGAGITENQSFHTWSMWTQGCFCYYWSDYETFSDTMFRKNFGALYNWNAVNDVSGLAPEGWHIPTDEDWLELKVFLMNGTYSWDGSSGENKIAKSLAAQADWNAYDSAGAVGNNLFTNNTTGFSASGGGYRNVNADFTGLKTIGCWWSTTLKDSTATMFYMTSDRCGLEYSTRNIKYGLSVRLVRDR